ncbi:MAG: hypothetical protein WB441_14665 [Nocardioidaceae bacterium]
MMTPIAVLGLLLMGSVIWLVILLLARATAAQPVDRHEQAELRALRVLVDDLKETAWDHRELDSPLATIVIDKIRQHERRGRELGG